MENSHGMEQKLDSNDIVLSMEVMEVKNESSHIGSQPKEVHRVKSYMQAHTEPSSSSHQVPKPIAIPTGTMPIKTLDESISRESLPEPNPISTCTNKANSKTKKANERTRTMINQVPEDPQGEEDDGDDVDEDKKDDGGAVSKNIKVEPKKDKKWEVMNTLEFTLCVCIIVVYVTSITVTKIKDNKFWGLEIWRWCVLSMAFFCGRLLTAGFTNVLVFLVEKNFLFKKKVLYFVYSLKRSVQVFFWLSLILLTWVILIRKKLEEPKDKRVFFKHITRFLLSSVLGAGLWVVKTFLVKILACSFHVKRFFDRIQESILHQYVLLALAKQPVQKKTFFDKVKTFLIVEKFRKGKTAEKQVIDVKRLSKMINETVSAWTISGLVRVIEGSELATISSTLDGNGYLTSEEDAKRAGNQIFEHVAKATGPSGYIDNADLLSFLPPEFVEEVFKMFNCSAEPRQIRKSDMEEWVVNVYKERQLLTWSLRDAKTAIEELNKMLSGIALIAIIVVWLILMGLATSEMLLFIASQFVLAAFIFGDSCKTGFECIIFVFVMHPYDVGDRCIIDDVQMTVGEMNILTTIFKSGKDTIVYPNSVLATKPITNLYRTPDLSENVEFVIDASTSSDTITELKNKISTYLEKQDKEWYSAHKFKEIQSGNKLKMVLFVYPTNRFQENSNRRPKLLSKLKAFIDDLEIKYHYLPQETHHSNVGTNTQ